MGVVSAGGGADGAGVVGVADVGGADGVGALSWARAVDAKRSTMHASLRPIVIPTAWLAERGRRSRRSGAAGAARSPDFLEEMTELTRSSCA